MRDETELIRFAADCSRIGGKPLRTVNPPVYSGSTVLFDRYADLQEVAAGRYPGITYGTHRLPPQREFEEALRQWEEGSLCRIFQSGINAIIHTLLAFTKAGDHILVCDNVYGPTARFCVKVLARYGVETTFIPPDAGENVKHAMQTNTRLVFLESPGSNTFELQDLRAIIAEARSKGVLTVLDNTWATPLFLKPIPLGINISIQSVTKYIGGHSDLLLGAVTVDQHCAETFSRFYDLMETFAPPADCGLALRGLRTLAVRLRQHERSALEVAQWLRTRPEVDRILHPALAEHPQHHLWRRDFLGSSGLFAFTFVREPPDQTLAAFVDHLQLFGLGYSWGGYKSLLTVGKVRRTLPSPLADRTLIRLNIGLEAAEDLIEDLQQAFATLHQ